MVPNDLPDTHQDALAENRQLRAEVARLERQLEETWQLLEGSRRLASTRPAWPTSYGGATRSWSRSTAGRGRSRER